MSLLEWMMTKVPFYGRILQDEEDELGDYNPLIITKLLKNYRSHPSILEVRSIHVSEIRTGAHKCIIIVQYIITSLFIGKRTVSMKVEPNPDDIYDNYYLVH